MGVFRPVRSSVCFVSKTGCLGKGLKLPQVVCKPQNTDAAYLPQHGPFVITHLTRRALYLNPGTELTLAKPKSAARQKNPMPKVHKQ